METSKIANRSPDDTGKFERLVRTVLASGNLSELIQRIGSERGMLDLCRSLATLTPESHPTFWLDFNTACRRQKAVPAEITEKIRIVMGSLGLPCHRHQPDPYAVLDLAETASPGDIRRAYRNKAKRHHPDTGDAGQIDTEAFVRLNAAYTILKDPARRRHYDETHSRITQWLERTGPSGPRPAPAGHEKPRLRPFLIFLGAMLALMAVSLVLSVVDQQRSLHDGLRVSGPGGGDKMTVNLPVQKEPEALVAMDNATSPRKMSAPYAGVLRLPDPDAGRGLPDAPIQGLKDPFIQDVVDHRNIRKARAGRPSPVASAADGKPVEIETKTESPFLPHESVKDPDAEDEGAAPAQNRRFQAGSKIIVNRMENPPATIAVKPEHPDPSTDSRFIPVFAFMKDLPDRPAAQTDPDASNPGGTAARQPRGRIIDPREDNPLSMLSGLSGLSGENGTDHRIHAFFDRYRDAFKRRDMVEFQRFFARDAVENGTPFSSMKHQYEQIFAGNSRLEYKLDLYSYTWLVDQQRLLVRGGFSISSLPIGGSWQTRGGSITFDLVEKQGDYQVQRIDFTLNP